MAHDGDVMEMFVFIREVVGFNRVRYDVFYT